jgi:acyl-CoA thioester hydrolase
MRHRVIYGDTDAMGIVYYGTYLRFLEIGRNEFVRAQGGEYKRMEAAGYFLPVTEVQLRYRSPARYDDVILIKTKAFSVGRIQVKFGYELRREGDDTLLAEGFTMHACLDAQTQRPTRLPADVRAWLLPAPTEEGA